MRDCPSKRGYIVTKEGGYVSASDGEDDLVLQDNMPGTEDDDGYALEAKMILQTTSIMTHTSFNVF